jgi:hypothetical protein
MCPDMSLLLTPSVRFDDDVHGGDGAADESAMLSVYAVFAKR